MDFMLVIPVEGKGKEKVLQAFFFNKSYLQMIEGENEIRVSQLRLETGECKLHHVIIRETALELEKTTNKCKQ